MVETGKTHSDAPFFRWCAIGLSWVTGFYPNELPGSTFRFIVQRFAILLVLALIFVFDFGAVLDPEKDADVVFKWFSFACTIFFFFNNIVVPLLLSNLGPRLRWLRAPSFKLSGWRLMVDILISGTLCVLSATLIFSEFPIVDTADKEYVPAQLDYLYFSVVTFSTLGYGDFRSGEALRLPASMLAVAGNIHLGLLAGSVFFALQDRKEDQGPAAELVKSLDEVRTDLTAAHDEMRKLRIDIAASKAEKAKARERGRLIFRGWFRS
ncbi:MAG: ion channel [Pseudomonadota bacterium]